jgi:hypothetical protein
MFQVIKDLIWCGTSCFPGTTCFPRLKGRAPLARRQVRLLYSHPVAPSRFHRRYANISYINTTNMFALIKLKLPLTFVLPTREVHV